MEVKKCTKCGKGPLIKVHMPKAIKDEETNKTRIGDMVGWRCNSCGKWEFEKSIA